MNENRYSMGASYNNITITTNKKYNLTVDLQWYGYKDNKFYSYLLSSSHKANSEPTPPYFITGFCMNKGKIIPLRLSESKYALTTLKYIIESSEDIKFKGLEIERIMRIKNSKFKKPDNNSFYIPDSNIRILTGNPIFSIESPKFYIEWGRIESEVFELMRVSSKNLNDYLNFNMNIEFNQESMAHNYKDNIKLFIDYGRKKNVIFSAFPTKVIPISTNVIEVRTSNMGEHLKHQRMGALSTKNCNPIDLLYLITRMGGIKDSNLNIEGLSSEQKSIYTVIFPLENLKINSNLYIANTELINGLPNAEEELFNFHSKAMNTIGWNRNHTTIRINVLAKSFYDAYITAAEEVEKSLDVISHFSRSSSPYIVYSTQNNLCNWDRSNESPQPKRKEYALIVNNTYGGNILIDWEHIKEPNLLKNGSVFDVIRNNSNDYEDLIFYGNEIIKSQSITQVKALIRSLRWLRRCWEAEDIVDKVIFASTALELSVAGIEIDAFILKEDADLITENAIGTLENLYKPQYDKDTSSALKQKISNALTEPPLMAKVKHIIEELDIPITKDEIKTLRKVRQLRNKILHGGNEDVVTIEELENVHMLISKLSSWRINKLIHEIRKVN